ncbi:HlyC/CorC family transporter [Lysinibacillus yapensis]|uniref:HlyC/CorC family transporter n=1 Tax=Ureibacillus yapensis TaxID=2304605 RepID=A0A396S4J3_9BACL|nr:hemolysin family protein [Lysinibacillus yapensis]RHW34066.1 HlyC/CorC family transporter [Lysinibacillus yapensis]
MGSIWISVVIVLILIVANGIFAMTEIAIVTSKKNRLEKMRDEGNASAAYALKLAEDPNQLLSTIQIGITLIGVFTGAFGGATIASELAVYVERVEVLAPISYQLSFIIVVGLSTYLSLIIGELVPKRIGMGDPEKVACAVAKPMFYFSKIGRPIISFLSISTEFVLKIMGIKPTKEPDVTEEEISQLIAQGVYSGVVEEIEQNMVEQIFYLGDKRLRDILTTRTQLVWIDIENSFEENMKIMKESPYSKFPVGEGSLDNFKGIIHAKNLLSNIVAGEKFALADYVEETLVLPEAMKVFQALETFKIHGQHEAIIIDEYGGIEGFVTLHDIMENIVGEMPEKDDEEDPQIIERNENSWLADGLVSIDAFIRFFDLEDNIIMNPNKNFHTLGGFITDHIGDIPKLRDIIQLGELQLEVVDMDGVRVDKVLISKIEVEEEEED